LFFFSLALPTQEEEEREGGGGGGGEGGGGGGGGGDLCYSFSYFVDQSFQFTSLHVIRVQN